MATNYEVARVEYGNSRLLEDVYVTIKQTASEVFKETASASQQDERCKLAIANFEQSFRETMSENLRFVKDEEKNEEANGSNSRLHYYCTEVLPKVDTILVDVARKRKTYPAKCRQRLQTKLVSEAAQYETNLSGELNVSKRLKEEEKGNESVDLMDEELIGLAKSVATNLTTIKQISHRVTSKANSLRIAQTQFGQNGDLERKLDISDFAISLKTTNDVNH